MKAFYLKMVTFFSLLASDSSAQSQAPAHANEEERNRQIIVKGFNDWASGSAVFFDLLTEDVKWTISGSSPLSATYNGKQELMDKVITPLNQRLSEKIVPTDGP